MKNVGSYKPLFCLLGVSVRSVQRLLGKARDEASIVSPKKRYEKSRQRVVADDFDKVTPDRWKSLIAHVQEKEDHYWEADGLQMKLVEEFIIIFRGGL